MSSSRISSSSWCSRTARDVQLILREAGVGPGPDRRGHDPRPRQAALRVDLDPGLLRPRLPRDPGRLELRRAPGRRPDGALGIHPPRGARRCRCSTRCSPRSAASSRRSTPRRSARGCEEVLDGLDRGSAAAGADASSEADAPARARRRLGAGEVCHRPHRPRPGRQDRPGGRPRPGDPPDHRRADAAAAEQPDPDRRGRGRARPPWSRASRCGSRKATCRRC